MKAIVITQVGDPSVLEYVDVPTPRPKAGEVLVKAHTIGVNRPELAVRKGTYGWMPPLPAIPGIEMSGVVAEVGEGLADVAVGQKVFITARDLPERAGCYAEYIAVPRRALRLLPPNADLEAAACLSSYQMAYYLLHVATRGVTGKSALIDIASGGIGSAAVQLAKIIGMAPVIALVGSDEKAAALEAFGADHAINAEREDVAARVNAITQGEGVDLIVNGGGGKTLKAQLTLLAPLGLGVLYGSMLGPPEPAVDPLGYDNELGARCAAIRLFNVHLFDERPDDRERSIRYLIDRLAAGQIRPLIHARLPLKDARHAHEIMEARQAIGKILLKPAHQA